MICLNSWSPWFGARIEGKYVLTIIKWWFIIVRSVELFAQKSAQFNNIVCISIKARGSGNEREEEQQQQQQQKKQLYKQGYVVTCDVVGSLCIKVFLII